MSARLDNCTRCDALFMRGIRDVCPKCAVELEKEYELVAKFLRKRENKGSTVQQVSDGTGVSVKQITRFIKEGRISMEGNSNFGYPCDNCDTLIQKGNLCESCASGLQREINQQMDVEKRLATEEKNKKNIGYQRKGPLGK